MRKKGMLLASETLKMILAVIGIAFLVYLLTSLYFASSEGKKKESAQLLLDRIKSVSKTLDPINKVSENITDVSPAGWEIFSYDENSKKPNQCVGEDCICICDSVYSYAGIFGDRQLKECSDNGVCDNLGKMLNNNTIEIGSASEPTSIELYRHGVFLGVRKI